MLIVALFLIALVPVLAVAAVSYMRTRSDLTASALSRRQTLAYLAAATLNADLNRLTDIGVALATRVRFGQLVAAREWDQAIQIGRFPGISR